MTTLFVSSSHVMPQSGILSATKRTGTMVRPLIVVGATSIVLSSHISIVLPFANMVTLRSALSHPTVPPISSDTARIGRRVLPFNKVGGESSTTNLPSALILVLYERHDLLKNRSGHTSNVTKVRPPLLYCYPKHFKNGSPCKPFTNSNIVYNINYSVYKFTVFNSPFI